jgi:hypothetical protein
VKRANRLALLSINIGSIAILFYGCDSTELKRPPKEVVHKVEAPSNLIQVNKLKAADTFPDWVKALYLDQHSSSKSIGNNIYKLLNYRVINDSISYGVYTVDNRLCLYSFLQIFNQKKKIRKAQIGESCDHDHSIDSYSWSTYKIIDDTLIHVSQFKTYISNKELDSSGMMNEGLLFEDYSHKRDSSTLVFKILQSGKIEVLSI